MSIRVIAVAALAAAGLAASGGSAWAQIKVGMTVPLTGPASTLGIGARDALSLVAPKIAGMDVEFTVLDDGTDTTQTVLNVKKLINETKADIIIGSSTTPQCLAALDTIADAHIPNICLGASQIVASPVDQKRRWVFKTAANDELMATGVFDMMAEQGVKTLAFIGFDDAYGQSWLDEMNKRAPAKGIKVLDVERYARRDTDVSGQVLKIISLKPDAVLIGGADSPGALPAIALNGRGYRGKVYLSSGVASMSFLRVGGRALNGAVAGVGPNLVWEQLPDSNPTKAASADFVPRFEAKFGKENRSNFAAQAYDAWVLLQAAVPVALQKAKPGTQEFREALRDALEGVKEVRANAGVFNYSPTDHGGLDMRAVAMTRIQDGKWVLVKDYEQPGK